MIAIPQIFTALIIGVCYYMLAVVLTVYDGALSLIFQPIMGAILTAIAIAGLFVIGLPLRLIKRINTWWKLHWWIPFFIGTIAFMMMCMSWMPHFRVQVLDPDLQIEVDSFHPFLATGGWLLTLFAVLHFYPPWLRQHEKAEQSDAANSRASCTSGTADAGASAPPEASGNS